MTSPSNNVATLRDAGVIPPEVMLTQAHEKAINGLAADDVATLIRVHQQVGTIEHRYEGPYKMFIF